MKYFLLLPLLGLLIVATILLVDGVATASRIHAIGTNASYAPYDRGNSLCTINLKEGSFFKYCAIMMPLSINGFEEYRNELNTCLAGEIPAEWVFPALNKCVEIHNNY